MSIRKAYTRTAPSGISGAQASDLAPILERLIATLNRIEAKLDKLEN